MASKTKCTCCATLFLGTPISCKACKQPSCAICRTNGSQPGNCCKCSNEQCARTSSSCQPSTQVDNNDSSASEFSEPDPSLQDGFMHPETKFGRRYKGVGPRGPSLAEFQQDSRWNWMPYQMFVKHVFKHLSPLKQLSAEEFLECASYATDYGIDSPGWNGLAYDPNLRLSEGPHPNYYEPEPVEAFQTKVSKSKPETLDPPDALQEIPSAASNDPGSYFCYDYLWTPGPLEDPNKYPWSFATVGSGGVHFFNKQHVMAKEYCPADRISAIASDLDSESLIYLHREALKVTVGSLSDPDDIVLEFDLPTEYNPRAIGVIKTENGNQAVIHGYTSKSLHTVMLYDLNSGSQTANIPIKRYEHDYKHPVITRGANQPNLVMDPARPNVCYLGFASETGLAVVDTRMNRAARWIKWQDEIHQMVIQPYDNCDKLVYSKGNALVMFDLVAGKARYQHTTLGVAKTDIAAIGLATYGEQIAVGRFNRGGSDPIVSWFSWEHFESGSYFNTKKDSKIPCSGGNFIAANSSGTQVEILSVKQFFFLRFRAGIYAVEHRYAMHAPWQAPLNGTPMVRQVSAPSTTAGGVAPAQKGVRRAKRETVANSFADPVNAPAPSKPTAFTTKYLEGEGLPSVAENDRHGYSTQLWVAEGIDNPDNYPFSILGCGSDGVIVYDHSHNFVERLCTDSSTYRGGISCIYPHAQTKTLLAGSDDVMSIFSFDNFKTPKSTIKNIGFTPRALTVMTRSAPQIVIGGDDLNLHDMATGRRLSEIHVSHGGSKMYVCGLKTDRHRPDVLYVMGYENAFLVDLRENPKAVVRSFVHSHKESLYSMMNTEYGPCDKLVTTMIDSIAIFDIGSGKVLKEVNGVFEAASAYGSTLCVGCYTTGVDYYDIENLTATPIANTELPARESAPASYVKANWKGVYRKAADKLHLLPFKGTKQI